MQKKNEQQQRLEGLSSVQRMFLRGLSSYEEAGGGGTALRLYNDVVQRGRTKPITEGDLLPNEQRAFEMIVRHKAEQTGKSSGKIDYPDYNAVREGLGRVGLTPGDLSSILGGFKYSIADDGTITITDKWDFNVAKAGFGEESPVAHALAAFTAPVALAATIGRKVVPDVGGRGIPVTITLRKK